MDTVEIRKRSECINGGWGWYPGFIFVDDETTSHWHDTKEVKKEVKKEVRKDGTDTHISEMPKCDACNSNKHVAILGPDTFGHEFRCEKCGTQWAQST